MFDDLRFALRHLRRAPLHTAAAILTLAFAIGANTAIFSVADAVLFRRLPYAEPDRVFVLQMMNRDTGQRFTSISNDLVHAIDAYHGGITGIATVEAGPMIVTETRDGAEAVATAAASANYFELLGVRAARGRVLQSTDIQSTARPAMMTYRAWQTRFGGDETIVGRPIALGTSTYDIVGILPSEFVFASAFAGRPEIVATMPPVSGNSSGGTFNPVVRLAPGVTKAQAQAELDALATPIAAKTRSPRSLPQLDEVRSVLYPFGRAIMQVLLAGSALLLLLGCANLANMLLVQTHQRERETGVRAALGATRARLVRPVIIEAVVIGAASAGLALLITWAAFDVMLRQVPPLAYRNAPVGLTLRVVLFALGLGIVSGLAFAAIPVWRSARRDVQALIQQRADGRRRPVTGKTAIALQVAVAIVLVFGAAVAARAFVAVLRVPLGFDAAGVITVRLFPRDPLRSATDSGKDAALSPQERQRLEALARHAFYERAIATLAGRADVASVGAASSIPLDGSAPHDAIPASGPGSKAVAIVHMLPGYFEAIRQPLLRGRLPNLRDVSRGIDVAVASESAARLLFPDRDPVGASFENRAGRRFEVVGVVADITRNLQGESRPEVYVTPKADIGTLTLVVRTERRDPTILAQIRRDLGAIAAGTPVTAAWWAESIAGVTAYRNPRFQTMVLGTFAVIALALIALGIATIVSFIAATRARELGIRLAMGATPPALVALLVRQTLVPVAAGLAIGGVATRWFSQLIKAQLTAVDTDDPAMLIAAIAIIVCAAIIAAYIPARRGSRVDPIVVLRAE